MPALSVCFPFPFVPTAFVSPFQSLLGVLHGVGSLACLVGWFPFRTSIVVNALPGPKRRSPQVRGGVGGRPGDGHGAGGRFSWWVFSLPSWKLCLFGLLKGTPPKTTPSRNQMEGSWPLNLRGAQGHGGAPQGGLRDVPGRQLRRGGNPSSAWLRHGCGMG